MVAKVPIRIRGVVYPSQAAAAKAHGVPPSAICGALDRGTLDNVGQGRSRHNLVPLRVGDVVYESVADAAQAHGVNPKTLRGHVYKARRGKRDWFHAPNIGVVHLVLPTERKSTT